MKWRLPDDERDVGKMTQSHGHSWEFGEDLAVYDRIKGSVRTSTDRIEVRLFKMTG